MSTAWHKHRTPVGADSEDIASDFDAKQRLETMEKHFEYETHANEAVLQFRAPWRGRKEAVWPEARERGCPLTLATSTAEPDCGMSQTLRGIGCRPVWSLVHAAGAGLT
jgi:hypothetical protein